MGLTIKKKPLTHTKAKPPNVPLEQEGRWCKANMLWYFGVSDSTFSKGVKEKRYPTQDGYDGKRPFWNTSTIRAFVENPPAGEKLKSSRARKPLLLSPTQEVLDALDVLGEKCKPAS